MFRVKLSLLASLFLVILFVGCQQQLPNDPVQEEANLMKPGGSALSLDGIDDYVLVPHDNSLNVTNGLTISAWVYFDGVYPLEYASVVTKGEDDPLNLANGPNNYTLHSAGDGTFYFTAETVGGGGFQVKSTNSPLAHNTWHNVAVTYLFNESTNSGEVKFYTNGSLVSSFTSPNFGSFGVLNQNTAPLQIGFDPPGDPEYWQGKIDEVKVWSEVLNESQIRVAMSAATPVARSLMGYWRFNEGSGLTARDRSSNGNDGTLVGGAAWSFPGAI